MELSWRSACQRASILGSIPRISQTQRWWFLFKFYTPSTREVEEDQKFKAFLGLKVSKQGTNKRLQCLFNLSKRAWLPRPPCLLQSMAGIPCPRPQPQFSSPGASMPFPQTFGLHTHSPPLFFKPLPCQLYLVPLSPFSLLFPHYSLHGSESCLLWNLPDVSASGYSPFSLQ